MTNRFDLFRPWSATHRVLIETRQGQLLQSVLVMRTDDGCGHTRFEWSQNLPASYRQSNDGSWQYIGYSETDLPMEGARIRAEALGGEMDVPRAEAA